MLSDKEVRAVKPIGKDILKSDGGGLYLRVSVHGTKTFIFRKKENGKTRYTTVGEYPHLSLADARVKASELQGKAIGIVTVNEAVQAFLRHLANEYEHPEQVKRRLEADITPTLGKKRLDSISTKDITDTLQMILDRGSPVAANRTLADVKHLFSYSYEKGWVRHDPSSRITRKVIGGKETSREIVLSEDQLKSLMEELRTGRWEPKTRAGLALCLLTGQRASEVLGIEKSELQDSWWTVPAGRTKPKRAQKVYLSRPARKILGLVDNTLGGDHRTLSKALRRAKVGYTPHDLRRTMATKLSEMGIAPHVVEKMLNHQMEGVMAIYNRAEYLKERKDAWKLWARYLLQLARAKDA